MVFGAEYRIINSRHSNTPLSRSGIQNLSIPSAHIPQQTNGPLIAKTLVLFSVQDTEGS